MARFDKFFQAVNKVTDPQTEEGDENKLAENPRNWLSGKVNSILPESVQIPLQTVADEKQQLRDLPQTMAGATMGSIETIPSARFGNILKQTSKEVPVGSVTVKPTTQNLLEEATKLKAPAPRENLMDAVRAIPENAAKLKEARQQMNSGFLSQDGYADLQKTMLEKYKQSMGK
jgi:hypothetical protein